MVQYLRKLEPDLQKIVQKVMQRNAYFAHPEAILLSMLADEDGEVRAQAILAIHIQSNQGGPVEIQGDDGRGMDEEDEELPEEEENDAF